jgi:hypothetical protein
VDQLNDLCVRSITSDGLENTQRKIQEMENKMDEMQKSMKFIEIVLLQRIPKRDMEIQENHENKENNGVETQSHVGNILSQLESTNIESQDHSSL